MYKWDAWATYTYKPIFRKSIVTHFHRLKSIWFNMASVKEQTTSKYQHIFTSRDVLKIDFDRITAKDYNRVMMCFWLEVCFENATYASEAAQRHTLMAPENTT